MKVTAILFFFVLLFACTQKKSIRKFSEVEIISDAERNIIMTKSGIADSNNSRIFKYYDTTGRLVFVIEWGGLNQTRRMLSPQILDTGINTVLAGELFYKEYLLSTFGQINNFWLFIGSNKNDEIKVFNIVDSVIFKNFKFHLLKAEFDNLQNYLR